MTIQKVITSNGTELLTARMMRENLALVYEDRSRRNQPRRVILMNPREAWELHDFIEQHGAPRPTEYLKSVFCEVNEGAGGKTVRISERQYNQEAWELTRQFCEIYRCRKCGHPVVDGYCCAFCKDPNPQKPNVLACPSAPMQAGAQGNGEITPPALPKVSSGAAGNLSSQPTTKEA